MIKKVPYNKRNIICRFNELALNNMELRNRIQLLESELKSLRENIKNDIDNVKYVIKENAKIFNEHTHVQSEFMRTFHTDMQMQLIK